MMTSANLLYLFFYKSQVISDGWNHRLWFFDRTFSMFLISRFGYIGSHDQFPFVVTSIGNTMFHSGSKKHEELCIVSGKLFPGTLTHISI